MLHNPINIVEGWYNLLTNKKLPFLSERAQECNLCEEAKYQKTLEIIKDDLVEVKSLVCTQCGCPLSAKIRSKNETCPLGKW